MTVSERASEYFGPGNVRYLQAVKLGRRRVAFVDPTRIWIYDGEGQREHGMVLNLTGRMRVNLLEALDPGWSRNV